MRVLSLLVLALFLALVGCGETDTGLRVSLELEFELRGQDADGDGSVEDLAPIDLSDDAPWRVFTDRIANDFENGPGDLKLHDVSMRLSDTSEGVQTLGEVFNGPIAFRLRTSDTQREYNLAVADIRASSEATTLGTSCIELKWCIEFEYQVIEESEREAILAGEIGWLFFGQAGDDFRGSDSVAILSARFEFEATAPAEPPP